VLRRIGPKRTNGYKFGSWTDWRDSVSLKSAKSNLIRVTWCWILDSVVATRVDGGLTDVNFDAGQPPFLPGVAKHGLNFVAAYLVQFSQFREDFIFKEVDMDAQMKLIEQDFDKVLVAGSIKTAMKESGSGSRDLWQVPIEQIKVIEGLNPRVFNDAYKAHIRSIADSIKSEGFYQDQALAGYVAKEEDGSQSIYVYSGHSRLAAAKLAIKEGAELQRLPVVVSTAGLDLEDITVSLIRGNGGKNLTYYESAIVVKRLAKMGLDLEEISRRTGITVALIKNRLALMAAPSKLREMVANDEISATLAIDMLNKHGSKVLEAIQGAVEVASTEGKNKVRKAQTVEKTDALNRAKFLKKAAPQLYEAADLVRKDPGFASLSQDTRDKLEKLLAEIQGDEGKVQPEVDPRQIDIEDKG